VIPEVVTLTREGLLEVTLYGGKPPAMLRVIVELLLNDALDGDKVSVGNSDVSEYS
jgi:hypothetical protein